MKTPEEMAEEYAEFFAGERRKTIAKKSWWTGYQAAQQWISVKERLPDEGQDCLFYVDWIDKWDKGSKRINYQDIGVFDGKDRFYHHGHTGLEDVSHWMPLPVSPKEEV